MSNTTDLLARPLYGVAQVDRLLGLTSGTARRWLEGYRREDRVYPPVIRPRAIGTDVVTWGEFVETRLLSEYRNAGVPVLRMRPAIERLREDLGTDYPLAHAQPFVSGRELVLEVQNDVGLERQLCLVVIRNNQIVLTQPAQKFVQSVEFSTDQSTDGGGIVERLYPLTGVKSVVVDPLRQFGEPVVRSVPTEVIAEQMRAGDSMEMIAEIYDLTRQQVESAVRYELLRGASVGAA